MQKRLNKNYLPGSFFTPDLTPAEMLSLSKTEHLFTIRPIYALMLNRYLLIGWCFILSGWNRVFLSVIQKLAYAILTKSSQTNKIFTSEGVGAN